MSVLVTGGAGFVGTNLIKRLLNEGSNVISVDNYSTGYKKNHQDGCEYYDIDITDPFDLQSVLIDQDINIIYHIAALARIQPSLQNPTKSIRNNFDSTLHILEWAREDSIPVVFAGSSSYHHGLYGSPYAWSKHAGEQLCQLYNKVYNLPTSICRFYNVYGPHQLEEGTYATVLGIFEKQYREGKPLTITGDGKQRRDFTHVDDIVDGLIRAGNKHFEQCEVFELGRGRNFSINEITEMFNHFTEYIPARHGEYPITLCDYSHAQNLLGWKPKLDVSDYIEELISK